jgi:hypothetical protein
MGNRTRCIPACSTVPQRTTLPRAPKYLYAVGFSVTHECIKTKKNIWTLQTLGRHVCYQSIWYLLPLNLSCILREKGDFFICVVFPFIHFCAAESGLWRINSKAVGLFTPWSVYPLPGSRLILTRELQSDRLMQQQQSVHFPLFSFIADVNAHVNSFDESFNGCWRGGGRSVKSLRKKLESGTPLALNC